MSELITVKLTKKQHKHLVMVLDDISTFHGCRVSDIVCDEDFTVIEQVSKKLKKVDVQ